MSVIYFCSYGTICSVIKVLGLKVESEIMQKVKALIIKPDDRSFTLEPIC